MSQSSSQHPEPETLDSDCACQKLRKRRKVWAFKIHHHEVAGIGSSKGPASQRDKIGESLTNRSDLSLLKTLFAPRQLSVGTSSPRPSGYARTSRFAKEFGPDQVLRSDNGPGGVGLVSILLIVLVIWLVMGGGLGHMGGGFGHGMNSQ